jgi:hypothetical protein
VRGGRNRNPRLQVLDAAAVDTRRRLVLVRRDDVEHLIMIGGPTDIVIESRITPTPVDVPFSSGAAIAAPSDPAIGESFSPSLAEAIERPRQRPAIEPRPEMPRQEALRSEPLRAPPAQPIRPAAEPIAAQPAPAIAPAPVASRPEPVATPAVPPISTPSLSGLVRTEPARPLPDMSRQVPIAPKPVTEPMPAIDDAANALEAARGRVLSDRTEQPKVVAINSPSAPTALPAAVERPKALGSDFEKILEEEMAQNLAAREAATPRPNRQTPPRDPAAPLITGATTDPSLQDEVARIFGEMSATRDK